VYQTARGYFVVTPETRRRRLSSSRRGMASQMNGRVGDDDDAFGDDHVVARTTKATVAAANSRRSMLMSAEEALVYVYGDMHTIRDGAVTHQCVQTNLADVLCGGTLTNPLPPSDAVRKQRIILQDLFSSVLSHCKKYHPSGNMKINYLGIFQSWKLRILMEQFLLISLKLNFTPKTSGCYGLRIRATV